MLILQRRGTLPARRHIESGVHFVEVSHGDGDQPFPLSKALRDNGRSVDQPIAGRLTDLQPRGLLTDTLVIRGGEFGPTPHPQGSDGRDHHHKAFPLWIAGGGGKDGPAHGLTDDHGYEVVEDHVHRHDLHAAIRHLLGLGLDHERLTSRYAGRDFPLTEVKGNVAKEIMT